MFALNNTTDNVEEKLIIRLHFGQVLLLLAHVIFYSDWNPKYQKEFIILLPLAFGFKKQNRAALAESPLWFNHPPPSCCFTFAQVLISFFSIVLIGFVYLLYSCCYPVICCCNLRISPMVYKVISYWRHFLFNFSLLPPCNYLLWYSCW